VSQVEGHVPDSVWPTAPRYTPGIAQPAPSSEHAPEDPPIDPFAIRRAYRRERARRRARDDRRRERRLAGLRFLFFVSVLLTLSVFMTLTVWQEIQRLFGL
jgi:hypothetical protein